MVTSTEKKFKTEDFDPLYYIHESDASREQARKRALRARNKRFHELKRMGCFPYKTDIFKGEGKVYQILYEIKKDQCP